MGGSATIGDAPKHIRCNCASHFSVLLQTAAFRTEVAVFIGLVWMLLQDSPTQTKESPSNTPPIARV
jgi:hypothetical protein